MEVTYAPEHPRLTEPECYLSPALLKHPTEEVTAYCQWVVEGVRIAAAHNEEKQALLGELLKLDR